MTKRKSTKNASSKAFDLFAKAAADLGMDVNTLDTAKEEYKKRSFDAGDSQPLARKISGEALLWRIENLAYAGEFVIRNCRRAACGQPFQTNYKADGYCSYQCTEADLREKYGIEYDINRPIEDRWGWRRERREIPLKISPSGLVALEKFAVKFLEDLAKFREREKNLAENPRAATRYLWEDRGLSVEKLDEYYPLTPVDQSTDPQEKSTLPDDSSLVDNQKTDRPNPTPQTQESLDQSSSDVDDLFGGLLD